MQDIVEGKAHIRVELLGIPTREMSAFYNPKMSFNRDITIALLRTLERKNLRIADPLAGTGVRSIRLILELPRAMVRYIIANDLSPSAVRAIRANIKRNPKSSKKIKVRMCDARELLRSQKFDYIDIDPFGYPGHFIDVAIESIAENGILAITATDTAALTGSAPGACMRKYQAHNRRGFLMHELGLRILIGWIAKKASIHNKFIKPIFSYSKDHYMRVFVTVKKRGVHSLGNVWWDKRTLRFGTRKSPSGAFLSGPLWTGSLGKTSLVKRICKSLPQHGKFLALLSYDIASNEVCYHDIHLLCSRIKASQVPPIDELIKALRKQGYNSTRTHFVSHAIKSNATTKDVEKTIRKFGARQLS